MQISEEQRRTGKEIKRLEKEIKVLTTRIYDILLTIPNLPHESCPEESTIVREWWPDKGYL